MHQILRSLLLPLVCLPFGLVSAQVATDLSDKELAPLAESWSTYLEARASSLGVVPAKADFAKRLAGLRAGPKGAHPLEQNGAMARALWLAHNYAKQSVRKGKLTEVVEEEGSFSIEGLTYAYRLPKKYDPAERAYPLILAIPDEDELPADHIRDFWSSRDLRDGAILVSPQMPEQQSEWAQVMVKGRPGGLCYVLSTLRSAQNLFAVDFAQVYISGRGGSVPAAVATGNYSPQRFAGIIGRAGELGEIGPSNFRNLPTFFSGHGKQAAEFAKGARGMGFDNCSLSQVGDEGEIWRWIGAHPRVSTPCEVSLLIGMPYPTRVNWLRLSPTAPAANASALIDREKNSITLTSEGASFLTLYLNDDLIDLDLPIAITRNGVLETFSLSRQLPATLDLAYNGVSDPACVYVAQLRLDMREGAVAAGGSARAPQDEEFDGRLNAALGDAAGLWDLHEWCQTNGRAPRSAGVLNKLLRLATDHAKARAFLAHTLLDGHWFQSTAALERYARGQQEATAVARGYKNHNGLWMHPEDVSMAGKGLVKDPETGLWTSAAERKRLQDGWARQDLDWVEAQDTGNIDRGKWLVDGEWLTLETANERHLNVDSMWQIPGAEVLLSTTVDRETALLAAEHMTRAVDDLRRVFGAEPQLPLRVTVLHDEEQYDTFAFGDPDGRRPATHAGRLQTVHSAYFAESWYPQVEGQRTFAGMGVSYWDALDPNGAAFGVHAVRLALGLSYVDALDPSPKAVRRATSRGLDAGYYERYEAEKKLPLWLRDGAAVYAERFFRDSSVPQDGDPWWARSWSFGSLAGRGGFENVQAIFDNTIGPEQRDEGIRIFLERGLLVSFMLDGDCAPVIAAHDKLKQALVAGRLRPSQVRDLEEALIAHETELRSYAGL